MKVKLFNPNPVFAEANNLTCISYTYGKGIEIVRHFGNIFKVPLSPNIHYLILSQGSEINRDNAFICSNKYDYAEHPNLTPEYTKYNSFKNMYMERYCGGLPTNVHGKQSILVFPFIEKIPFIFDLETEELIMMLPPEYVGEEGSEEHFDRMHEVYGDYDDLFPEEVAPEFKQLDVTPCGEYASISRVEYIIAYGWQLYKYHRDKLHMRLSNRRVKYIVFHIYSTRRNVKELVYSNKWSYDSHTKIADWMKEQDAHYRMFTDMEYAGLPCNVNGHRTIVCYPFMLYNPTIWDIDTDEVYVLPSRAYPEDPYYQELTEKYGELWPTSDGAFRAEDIMVGDEMPVEGEEMEEEVGEEAVEEGQQGDYSYPIGDGQPATDVSAS